MRFTGMALCVSLSWSASALAQARKEVGNLIIDGIPAIPQDTVDRSNQYQNTRSAKLVDWSPDGKGMMITTRFGDTNQLHHVAAPGAYRRQLTFTSEPVSKGGYDPTAPGGFYYISDVGGGEFDQIFWFDMKTGRGSLVTDGKSKNSYFLPSPKGGQYAYASTRRNRKDFDIYAAKGTDPKARMVKQVEGQWEPLDWSPDETQLLVRKEISINEAYLYLVDVASGDAKELNPQGGAKKIAYTKALFTPDGKSALYTSDEDSELLRVVRHDLATGKKTVLTPDVKWDVDLVKVSRDGRWLAYTLNEGGASALYLAPLAQPARARRLAVAPGVIDDLAFDRASKRLGYSLSSADASSDVYSFDLPAAQKPVRWTFSELGGLSADTFVTPSLIEFQSFDGKKLPAWYYKPRAAGKPVPVIVYIHGGPEAQFQPIFSSTIQYWVNELGAAVVAPNVRGSAGYGKSYLLLDNGYLREDSVKDIGSLLDWVAKQPELDASRVAVYGGSYGGFMVLATMAAFPDRFRCGVDVVGISNFVTFLERTEDYRRDLRRVEYGDERDPKMREFLTKISPTTNAARIKSPLFVVQGLNDPRVPANESEQIVATVRKNGGKVWYLAAKDEGHGFKRKSNKDYLNAAITLFFENHLLK